MSAARKIIGPPRDTRTAAMSAVMVEAVSHRKRSNRKQVGVRCFESRDSSGINVYTDFTVGLEPEVVPFNYGNDFSTSYRSSSCSFLGSCVCIILSFKLRGLAER